MVGIASYPDSLRDSGRPLEASGATFGAGEELAAAHRLAGSGWDGVGPVSIAIIGPVALRTWSSTYC